MVNFLLVDRLDKNTIIFLRECFTAVRFIDDKQPSDMHMFLVNAPRIY